mgnify:CR=1 FL=1
MSQTFVAQLGPILTLPKSNFFKIIGKTLHQRQWCSVDNWFGCYVNQLGLREYCKMDGAAPTR